MRNILTIMKKELSRVFKDKRLVFTTILMPGLLIFLMYTFIGEAVQNIENVGEDPVYSIASTQSIDNTFFETTLNTYDVKYNIEVITKDELNIYKERVYNGEIDYIIDFEDDFENKVLVKSVPNVNTFYNPSVDKSSNISNIINNVFNQMSEYYTFNTYGDTRLFSVNKDNNPVIVDDVKAAGKMISMLLPLLIIIFLFSGAMSVAPEAIAGDKERGTMATLLVTPIKRREIALGKIISLSIISVLSALSSFIGIIASLPKLMGFNEENNITDMYGIKEYFIILMILIVTVLLIVGLISVVSCLARNMKEASTYILPLYFCSMALGIASMFSTSASTNSIVYLIPLYSSLQSLVSVFTFDVSFINIIITLLSSLLYTSFCIFVLTKMFNNEKIMFSK